MDTNLYTFGEDISNIEQIDFCVLGNRQVLQMSALDKRSVGIENPELYDNLEPKVGGLIDMRMGTSTNSLNCATCGLDTSHCNGHFGHIVLADRVFHLGYLEAVKRILSCVCLKCSKLLINKNEDELKKILKTNRGKTRFAEIRNLVKKVKSCSKDNYGCGMPVPKITINPNKKQSSLTIGAEYNVSDSKKSESTPDANFEKKKSISILTPENCYDILRNISDKDWELMGFDHKIYRPEDLIIKILPVPPVQIRPSTKADFISSGGTSEDTLTHKLGDIVKANNYIIKDKETETGIKYAPEHQHLLQVHVASYFNNKSTYFPSSEIRGRPIKPLADRIKGKEGRIRGNLMGKRTDYSGRTVITPDPSIDLNELRIPLKIAKNLTKKETVTVQNIKRLTQYVRNGRDIYPGANFYLQTSMLDTHNRVMKIDLRYRNHDIQLKYGDIVERHLIDGDPVLFNRQPTLHRPSMMCHYVKVCKDKTINSFGLNLAITNPYNADFDGDEMNMFVSQDVHADTELRELFDAKKQIVLPSNSKNTIGVIQDGILGAYLLTQDETEIDWRVAMNLISVTNVDKKTVNIKKNKKITGKELYSFIIPNNINIKTSKVTITNGILIKGVMNKEMLGPNSDIGLIRTILDELGTNRCKYFLDNTQKLVNAYNLHNGFSIGIGDIMISKDIDQKLKLTYSTRMLEVLHKITEMENNYEVTDEVAVEIYIHSLLSSLLSTSGDLLQKNLNKYNGLSVMVTSKARGSAVNIAQMGGCVGQQDQDSGDPSIVRVKKKCNNRVFNYYHQNDDSAEARGFVPESFVGGLPLGSFVMHCLGGREGLIDTALKTADSGYEQKKLIKLLEDMIVKYDCLVRTGSNAVIQFMYADSGINPTKQLLQHINLIKLNNKDIKEQYLFTTNELKEVGQFDNDAYYKKLIKMRDTLRKNLIKAKLDETIINPDMIDSYFLPVNFSMIINNIHPTEGKLTAKYVLDTIDNILDYKNTQLLPIATEGRREQSESYRGGAIATTKQNSLKMEDERTIKYVFETALHSYLAPKLCIYEYKWSKNDFDRVVSRIIEDFTKAIIEPGEMVGIITAQSIGERTTQLTLNSFHSAGIGADSAANLGVGRLKEILSLSKTLKKPIMTIYLDHIHRQNKEFAKIAASHIEYVTIESIKKRIDIIYDPNVKNGLMTKDKIYNVFYSHSQRGCKAEIDGLPWVARIELDRFKLTEKNLTLLEIKSKFCSIWEKRSQHLKKARKDERDVLDKITNIAVLSSSEDDDPLLLHVRFEMKEYEFDVILSFVNVILDRFIIKGMHNIDKVLDTKEIKTVEYTDEGDITNKKEYIINTLGINMEAIRYLNGIDSYRTICNDVLKMYKLFGIESARFVLLKEIGIIINSSSYHNLSVLADSMTQSGNIMAINRHGMMKMDYSPLSKASFEKTVDNLLDAAFYNETDKMIGVSSRIMVGKVIKGGTGLCSILLDTDMLKKADYGEPEETMVGIEENTLMKDIIQKKEVSGFVPM